MKALRIKLFLMATTALTFNTLSAMMDAGDEAHRKAMASNHVATIKTQVEILKSRYDAGKAGGFPATQKAVIDDAASADFKALFPEVAKQKAAQPATLNPYLTVVVDELKGDIANWLQLVIPGIAGNAALPILDTANTGTVAKGAVDVAATNYAAGDAHPLAGTAVVAGPMVGIGKPSGGVYAIGNIIEATLHATDPLVATAKPNQRGSAAALLASNAGTHDIHAAKPGDDHANTVLAILDGILDSLKDRAVLATVPGVVAAHLDAGLAVPTNIGGKTTSALRRTVIKAVSAVMSEYVDDLMGGSGNEGSLLLGIAAAANGFLAQDAATIGNALVSADDMIPGGGTAGGAAGCTAAEFKLALDSFLTSRF